MTKIPEIMITETFIIKDLVMMCLSAILNINSIDVLVILKNLDDRINTGKITSLSQISIQVNNAYNIYVKYLPLLDSDQYNKYER